MQLRKTFTFLAVVAGLAALALAVDYNTQVRPTTAGFFIGDATDQTVGFWGTTPVVQPTGSAQGALTNSTTGTASSTLAAGTGVTTVSIPIQLSAMTTAAADLVTNYTPGYAFKVLTVDFVTTKLGTGAGATQTLNLEIGSTNVTGGVVNPTLASTDTLGELTAGTSVTAANTGTSADTLSVEVAASGTVFTAGDGILLIKLQNMDSANTASSLHTLLNAVRSALVSIGLIKGSA